MKLNLLFPAQIQGLPTCALFSPLSSYGVPKVVRARKSLWEVSPYLQTDLSPLSWQRIATSALSISALTADCLVWWTQTVTSRPWPSLAFVQAASLLSRRLATYASLRSPSFSLFIFLSWKCSSTLRGAPNPASVLSSNFRSHQSVVSASILAQTYLS